MAKHDSAWAQATSEIWAWSSGTEILSRVMIVGLWGLREVFFLKLVWPQSSLQGSVERVPKASPNPRIQTRKGSRESFTVQTLGLVKPPVCTNIPDTRG